MTKQTGVCKRFNATKGFGFITDTESGDDLFVHHSALLGDGFKTLGEGEQVEYEVEMDEQGRKKAVHVTGPNGAKVVGDERTRRGGGFSSPGGGYDNERRGYGGGGGGGGYSGDRSYGGGGDRSYGGGGGGRSYGQSSGGGGGGNYRSDYNGGGAYRGGGSTYSSGGARDGGRVGGSRFGNDQ